MVVVMSMALPEALAAVDVYQREGEKYESENDHEQIEHRESPSSDR